MSKIYLYRELVHKLLNKEINIEDFKAEVKKLSCKQLQLNFIK